GRANENIALTTIHQIFHSEHDRLVDDIKHTLSTDASAEGVADLNAFWQPAIRPFHVYNPDQNPAIPAEFAHAVYRFGHSMLDDDVARKVVDPNGTVHDNSLPLLKAFLNPPEYFDSNQTDAS